MRLKLLLVTSIAAAFLATSAAAPAAATSPNASCVGQFVTVFAPQSAGEFGGFVRVVAQTTEPNLGFADVSVDARAPHDQCD